MNNKPSKIAVVTTLAGIITVSMALLAWLGFTGGGECRLAGLRLFSLSEPWKPLLVIAAASAGILWALDVRKFRQRTRSLHKADWAFLVLMVSVFMLAVDGNLKLLGDGREYIIQTQSIALQQRLSIDTDFIQDHWNETEPFGVKLGEADPPAKVLTETSQSGGGFGGLYPDRFGQYRYYHFWAYSLVAAPLYAALNCFGGGLGYHAFQIMNAIFLLLPFIVAWRISRGWTVLGVMALVLVSPLIAYADWAHPELFCFALVALAFQLVEFKRARWWSPLLLGVAATQNLPIILLFPVHAYWFSLREVCNRETVTKGLISYGAGALLVFASMFYFRYWFGVWNVIEALELASLSNSSLSRVLSMLFSPLNGALWFYPAAFLFLIACLRKENVFLIVGMLLSVVATAWVASSTANFNAGQIGSARYAVWMVAPLTFLVLNGKWLPHRATEGWRGPAYMAAVALNVAIVLYFGTYQLVEKDIKRFGGTSRVGPETARLLKQFPFGDDPESLIENIVGREIPGPVHFNSVYVWNLGGKSLWVLTKRAMDQTRFVRWKGSSVPAYRSKPYNDMLVVDGDEVVLYPASITNYSPHPKVGEYVLLLLDAEPEAVTADCRVITRCGDEVREN